MTKHPNNLIEAMALAGYGIADLLPAFPGLPPDSIDQILRDNALALSRPVIPYGLLGIHPCRSRHFNITEHGFRWTGEEQPWPPRPDCVSIFFFGGSTGLGFNVDDADAIPRILRQRLRTAGLACEVYNFGSGNYSSRHELLRFLDLRDQGHHPHIAFFLDGYNDAFYTLGNPELVRVLDRLYQTEKRRRRRGYLGALWDFAVTSLEERRRPLPKAHTYNVDDAELAAVVSNPAIEAALAASSAPLPLDALTPGGRRAAETVWRRYRDSTAMIRALCDDGGTKALFAWQPVPYFATRPEQRVMEKLFPIFRAGGFSAPVYHWLHATGFPGMAEADDFVDLSDAAVGLDTVCYLDICHYTRPLAERIAERIALFLRPHVEARLATGTGGRS